MFSLTTTYYKPEDLVRLQENIICLEKNIQNPLIKQINLILQGIDAPEIEKMDIDEHSKSKLNIIPLGKRPTFNDLINHANLGIKSGLTAIIANSDIYFDSSLNLVESILTGNKVITLTRWDVQEDGSIVFFKNYKSQDTWIFNVEISEDIGHYHLGRYGCDNRFQYELIASGYHVINPALNIKSIHLHVSNLRPYFMDPNYERVPPPHRYVFPTSIHSPSTMLFLKLIAKRKYNQYKFDHILYYFMRYRFFGAISRNNMEDKKYGIVERIIAGYNAQFAKLMLKFFGYKL